MRGQKKTNGNGSTGLHLGKTKQKPKQEHREHRKQRQEQLHQETSNNRQGTKETQEL